MVLSPVFLRRASKSAADDGLIVDIRIRADGVDEDASLERRLRCRRDVATTALGGDEDEML
jgi:hypothetical protein